MKSKITLVARVLLGLIYFVFGLNGFLNFIPMTPPPMPEAAMDYMKGLMAAGYFMPLLKGAETLGGFMLLSGLAAPIGLLILTPITLHILLFHACMTPGIQNSALPIFMCILHALVALRFWGSYRPLFRRD